MWFIQNYLQSPEGRKRWRGSITGLMDTFTPLAAHALAQCSTKGSSYQSSIYSRECNTDSWTQPWPNSLEYRNQQAAQTQLLYYSQLHPKGCLLKIHECTSVHLMIIFKCLFVQISHCNIMFLNIWNYFRK